MADSCADGPIASTSVSNSEARGNRKDIPRGALTTTTCLKGLGIPPIKDECTLIELHPEEIIAPG